MTSSAAGDRRPARNCYKCGREIGPDESICEICNRAGMATPSATQYHGTIVVAIVGGVALLAVAASLAMRGIGPFKAEAPGFRLNDRGAVVATVRISNEGSKAGRPRCQLTARDAAGGALGVTSVSPQVAGGGTVTFEQEIPGVGGEVSSVSITCQ